jgi:hypothetical protein
LRLKVIVGDTSAVVSTGRSFYYAKSYTPMIKFIYPSTVFDSAKIRIWGMHGINKIGDGREVQG